MSRRVVLGSAAAIATVILAVALFSGSGLRHYRRLSHEAETLEHQNTDLARENQSLGDEVARLKGNERYVEKVARDEYGYVHPGDTVYLVPGPDSTP